jgi:hypothetical protein
MSMDLLPAKGSIRIFSFGGGVQSTAVLALQAMGKIKPFKHYVFSNVGDDSEHPATIAYINDVTKPFADRYGISFVETCKITWGKPETLLQYLHRTKRSIPIPVRMQNGAPGNRTCTADYKIGVVDKWIKSQGFSHAVIGLGISLDEFGRMRDLHWRDRPAANRKKDGSYTNPRPFGFWKKREYPLIDLRMSRQDALNVIQAAGLPEPPRSACWFCPFTSRGRWIEMKTYEPELFQQAIDLEQMLNEKRESIGRDRVYLHPASNGQLLPLADAVPDQLPLPFLDMAQAAESTECDEGFCFI